MLLKLSQVNNDPKQEACNSLAWSNRTSKTRELHQKESTWVAKTSSSPIAKRARKPYMLLNKKAPKQNAAPRSVVNDKTCQKRFQRPLGKQTNANDIPTVYRKIMN